MTLLSACSLALAGSGPLGAVSQYLSHQLNAHWKHAQTAEPLFLGAWRIEPQASFLRTAVQASHVSRRSWVLKMGRSILLLETYTEIQIGTIEIAIPYPTAASQKLINTVDVAG